MKVTAVCAGLLLFAAPLFGGSMEIIKGRARDLRNQNNAYQGAPTTPAVAPQPAAPPVPSTKNMAALETDLAGLTVGTPATEEQKQKISQDIIAACSGTYKPGATSATKLASDLAAVFTEKKLPAASRTKFFQELDAVFNPDKYPQARLDGIYGDIPNVLDRQGVNHRQAVLLVESLKTVGAECRGQKP